MSFVDDMLAAPRPEQLAALDLPRRESYFPSPVSWQDEVVYFLLVDRFSDGAEATRPLLDRTDLAAARPGDGNGQPWRWDNWATSGSDRYQGGTLTGLRSKLDYLSDLGVTTVWLEPGIPPARAPGHLPRLRNPGLSRCRPEVRQPGGSGRVGPAGPPARHSGATGCDLQPLRRELVLSAWPAGWGAEAALHRRPAPVRQLARRPGPDRSSHHRARRRRVAGRAGRTRQLHQGRHRQPGRRVHWTTIRPSSAAPTSRTCATSPSSSPAPSACWPRHSCTGSH